MRLRQVVQELQIGGTGALPMPGLDWLTARPIAHRGLHDAARGVIENTASAVAAAIAADYGIEVDVQVSADGEAMVHHDEALGRLTDGAGQLAALTAADLKRVPFKATTDRMMDLGDLLDLVAGRATLVIEIKSRFDGERRLAARVCDVLRRYGGPVAVMSFDPDQVLALREIAPALPRGIVAQQRYDRLEWSQLTPAARWRMAHLLHAYQTRPHFLAYAVRDLPALAPLIARHVFGIRLLTWTVRTEADRRRARWADQIIFEGLRP
jgi:glycerophosphoryl diester phosphodiesterase